ncbi:hypothetical protein I546_5651 [Mycobacterium kansasii 732]|nr:hypothetical protein I546_5651 [Mycobacterium kansasii 732]
MCADGFGCALWAAKLRKFRPEFALETIGSHSTPWPHARRRGLTLDAVASRSTPSAHARQARAARRHRP